MLRRTKPREERSQRCHLFRGAEPQDQDQDYTTGRTIFFQSSKSSRTSFTACGARNARNARNSSAQCIYSNYANSNRNKNLFPIHRRWHIVPPNSYRPRIRRHTKCPRLLPDFYCTWSKDLSPSVIVCFPISCLLLSSFAFQFLVICEAAAYLFGDEAEVSIFLEFDIYLIIVLHFYFYFPVNSEQVISEFLPNHTLLLFG